MNNKQAHINFKDSQIQSLTLENKKMRSVLENLQVTNKLLWGALAIMSLLLMAVWLHG